MKLIDKHILRNFLVPFVYILVSLLGLFLVYDISSKMARFLKQSVPFTTILRFYSLYVPQLITLGLPMVILMAIVLGMGKMSKNNEITAMRACGVSVLRIATPLFAVGLVLTAFSFLMFEKVVTRTFGEAKRFEETLKGRKPVEKAIPEGDLLTDEMGSLLHFGVYHTKGKRFEMITWQKYTANPDSGEGKIIVRADGATWIEDAWWMFGVRVVHPDGTYSPSYSKMKMYEWDFLPEEVTGERFPEEMSFRELRRDIKKYRTTPQKLRELEMQLHRRLALPLLNLLVIGVALPFGVKGGRRGGNIAVGVGVSMILCLAYYGLYVLLSLSHDLPPWLAVWLPNILFGIGGGTATVRMN